MLKPTVAVPPKARVVVLAVYHPVMLNVALRGARFTAPIAVISTLCSLPFSTTTPGVPFPPSATPIVTIPSSVRSPVPVNVYSLFAAV